MGILDMQHIFLLWKLRPKNIFGLDASLRMINADFCQAAQNLLIHDVFREILIHFKITEINDEYIIPSGSVILKHPVLDIAINPFGSRPDKSLSHSRSVALVKLICKHYPDLKIGIMSSPSTLKMAQSIQYSINKGNVFVIPDMNNFFDIVSVLKNSSLVITVDTSIVHISAGLKKNTIAIYYKQNNCFNRWVPRSDSKTIFVFSESSWLSYINNINLFNTKCVIESISNFMDAKFDAR